MVDRDVDVGVGEWWRRLDGDVVTYLLGNGYKIITVYVRYTNLHLMLNFISKLNCNFFFFLPFLTLFFTLLNHLLHHH